MNQIQAIFLFTSYKQLSKVQQEVIINIIRCEYGRIYQCPAHDLAIMLEDGMSRTHEDDIVLAIHRDQSVINEADYRTKLVNAVAVALKKVDGMRNIGYKGKIRWQDGLVASPSRNNAPVAGKDKPPMEKATEKEAADALDYHKRAKMYQAEDPKYTFAMLRIPIGTLEQIDQALARIEYERKVFQEWGLYTIMPSPVAAMSFFGPPGTGKSLAAEAIANRLNKRIIRASYADIENKYVGEGPKNVCALFLAAEEQDAVLLIDEADSLLSKRLVNVQEASGQAINSMRSQLLISLERFHGIVIFATNLVANYDAAFISRLINVEFKMPDAKMREEIWKAHLLPHKSGDADLKIPLAADIDFAALAEKFIISGRSIRNSVVDACVEACRKGNDQVDMVCLCNATQRCMESASHALKADDHTKTELSDDAKELVANQLQKQLDEKTVPKKAGEQFM